MTTLTNKSTHIENSDEKTKKLFLLLCVAVFFMPFFGVYFDVGGSWRISQLLMIILSYSAYRQFKKYPDIFLKKQIEQSEQKFVIRCILIFFISAFLANLFVFLFVEIPPQATEYFSGKLETQFLISFIRTNFKIIQSAIKELISFGFLIIPLMLIDTKKKAHIITWIYVISVSIQSFLGIVQLIIYNVTNVNIFPIIRGGFFSHLYATQTARITELEGFNFRVNALALEPTDLGFFIVSSIILILFFLLPNNNFLELNIGKFKLKNKNFILSLLSLNLICLYFTYSTLGYIMFVIVLALSVSKNLISLFISSAILVFFSEKIITTIFAVSGEIIQARFIDRLGFDDFDQVYLSFISQNPEFLLNGTGFGNFHLLSYDYAREIVNAFNFGIILPKLGVFKILAISGVVGLVGLSLLFVKLYLKMSVTLMYSHRNKINNSKVIWIKNFRYFLVPVFICLFLIRYEDVTLLFLALGYSTYNWYDQEII